MTPKKDLSQNGWKNHKVTEIKRILPIVWSSYQHMRDVRKNEINNVRNFLLLVISFLPIISLTLFTHFNKEIFFIPTIILLFAFITLIKTFFIGGPQVPWIEFNNTLKNLDSGIFDVQLFVTLKSLEHDTFTELTETGKYVTRSIYLILFSLYLLVLGVFFVYFSNLILYLSVVVLTIGIISLIYFYHKKQPVYNSKKEMEKYASEIERWLKE